MINGPLRAAALGLTVLSPIASQCALLLRQGYGLAVALSALQAVAAGLLAFGALPRRWRPLAPVGTVLLLGALLLGATRGPGAALLAAAGTGHAMLYAALLAVFAPTLRSGQESLITRVARRLNRAFHPGMVPYTRGVTAAWCVFFAAQLAASILLLATAPGAWAMLVTTVHAPLVLLMALTEYTVRAWRWRHDRHTGLRDTVLGVRRIIAEGRAGGGRTSP